MKIDEFKKEMEFLCGINKHKYHFIYILNCLSRNDDWRYYTGETKHILGRLKSHKSDYKWKFVQLLYFETHEMPFDFRKRESEIEHMNDIEKEELIKTMNMIDINNVNEVIGLPIVEKEWYEERIKRKVKLEIKKEEKKKREDEKREKKEEDEKRGLNLPVSEKAFMYKTLYYRKDPNRHPHYIEPIVNYLIDYFNDYNIKYPDNKINVNRDMINSILRTEPTNEVYNYMRNHYLDDMIEHSIKYKNTNILKYISEIISKDRKKDDFHIGNINNNLDKIVVDAILGYQYDEYTRGKFIGREKKDTDVLEKLITQDKPYLIKTILLLLERLNDYIFFYMKEMEESEYAIKNLENSKKYIKRESKLINEKLEYTKKKLNSLKDKKIDEFFGDMTIEDILDLLIEKRGK